MIVESQSQVWEISMSWWLEPNTNLKLSVFFFFFFFLELCNLPLIKIQTNTKHTKKKSILPSLNIEVQCWQRDICTSHRKQPPTNMCLSSCTEPCNRKWCKLNVKGSIPTRVFQWQCVYVSLSKTLNLLTDIKFIQNRICHLFSLLI